MNYEDFLKPQEEPQASEGIESAEVIQEENSISDIEEADQSVQIEVQKAVVESLAADKAEQDEKIVELEKTNSDLKAENISLKQKIEELKTKLQEQAKALNEVGEVLARNSESPYSNQVSLLDRNVELEDRFQGETRDQVLDALKEARDKAEADGRLRRAQILESVLVANEPTGNLAKKKAALEKFFNDNQNILSGPVIEELEKYGISYKHGEEYLLPGEIIKRTY